MSAPSSCVLLAASHHGLSEGIRTLLETEFDTVVMVADARSLCESAARLNPGLAVIDITLARGDVPGLIRRVRLGCDGLKVILLSGHDEPAIVQAARDAGADGFVSKGGIASDLLTAVDGILRGEQHFPD